MPPATITDMRNELEKEGLDPDAFPTVDQLYEKYNMLKGDWEFVIRNRFANRVRETMKQLPPNVAVKILNEICEQVRAERLSQSGGE